MSRTIYRACYYLSPTGQTEVRLTGREHSMMSWAALTSEALAEAHRADIVGDEAPRIPECDLVDGLQVGIWVA